MVKVLMLGSGPNAVDAARWPAGVFDYVVAINDAWHIRSDWSHMIHPADFPQDRRPVLLERGQTVVTERDYAPAQSLFGGAAFAGGGMTFIAGYWALVMLQPSQICYFGCDMTCPDAICPDPGQTNKYGYELYRHDPTDLHGSDATHATLSARARRLEFFAAQQGCAMANLSSCQSVLPYQRATLHSLASVIPAQVTPADARGVRLCEQQLSQILPASGSPEPFSAEILAEIDAGWLRCFAPKVAAVA